MALDSRPEWQVWYMAALAEGLTGQGEFSQAIMWFRRSIAYLTALDFVEAEIRSRRYLSYIFAVQERHIAAWGEVELALARMRLNDRHVQYRDAYSDLLLNVVRRQLRAGIGLDRNLALLREIEGELQTIDQELVYHGALGAMQELLGQRRQAEDTYRSQVERARKHGFDEYFTSAARNLLALRLERWRRDGASQPQSERNQRERESLLDAMRSVLHQVPDSEPLPITKLRLMHSLGYLGKGVQAITDLQNCVALSERSEQYEFGLACKLEMALHLAQQDLRSARALRQDALKDLSQTQSIWGGGRVTRTRIHLAWLLDEPEQALNETWAALASSQQYRLAQSSGTERAALFAAWVNDHRLAAGYAFDAAESARGGLQQQLLAAGLKIQETMRARQLLDEVLRQRERQEREQYLHENIRRVKKRAQRNEELAQHYRDADGVAAKQWLQQLEQLQQLVTLEVPSSLSMQNTLPAVIEQASDINTLQSALGSDEALVMFQWAPQQDARGDFAGNAWAVVISGGRQSANGIHLLNLSDTSNPAAMLDLLGGTELVNPQLQERVLSRLADDWLAPVLAALDRSVQHLIVVPDGALSRAPWPLITGAYTGNGKRNSAERQKTGVPPAVSVAPSASLWWQWRQQHQRPGEVLIVADPELDRPAQQQLDVRRGMAALPGAREEAAAIRRWFPRSKTLIGAAASESALVEQDLAQYGLVHFAAHAVVDHAKPEQSALLLAAGDSADGIMTSAEITKLDWSGRAVVLAACEGAAGQLLDGEGVFSLGRAFLSAGARAVIANLWPLEDREAQIFFERMYYYLQQGHNLGDALHLAQQDLREAGYSSRTWGGLVLIGDARMQAVEPPSVWLRYRSIITMFVGVMLLLYAWRVFAQRRRVRV